jgi:alpha-beta hydrolase superfamily lysophospholipase
MEKPDNGGLLSLIGKFVDNTDQVWKHLVCPFKLNYSLESLGPPTQMWGKTTYDKIDGRFTNRRGLNLQYSFYQAQDVDPQNSFTILYLHSHGACRVEGYHLLRVCGIYGISLCLLDFAGCGHSEGEFISMGIYEKDDALLMMNVLKNDYGSRHFAVWGRSMGAATALMAYPMFFDTFALILDSPFTTVSHVYRNAVKQRVSLPDFIIDMIFSFASSEIVSHYGFDVSAIRPYEVGPQIQVPTVLIGTREDQITDYNDLLELYNELKMPDEDKFIVECKGKHNDDRDLQSLTKVVDFLARLRKMKPIFSPSQRQAISSLLRPPSREVGLRNDYSKSIDIRPRRDYEPKSLGNPANEALRKLTSMAGPTEHYPLIPQINEEEQAHGSNDYYSKGVYMDYTPRALNQTHNLGQDPLRTSFHRGLRSNRSVNTNRVGRDWSFIQNSEQHNSEQPSILDTSFQVRSPESFGQDHGVIGLQRKSRGTLNYSLGNLFPSPMQEVTTPKDNFSERKMNILGFIDQRDRGVIENTQAREHESSSRSKPVDSHRLYHHQDSSQSHHMSPSNQNSGIQQQRPMQYLNLGQPNSATTKSTYRPFTLGPKKLHEGPFTLRNAKSSKLFNEELLGNNSEHKDQHTNIQPVAPQQPPYLAEPTYFFNPLLGTYTNSHAKAAQPFQVPMSRPTLVEHKNMQLVQSSPLDYQYRVQKPQYQPQNHQPAPPQPTLGFGLGRQPSTAQYDPYAGTESYSQQHNNATESFQPYSYYHH